MYCQSINQVTIMSVCMEEITREEKEEREKDIEGGREEETQSFRFRITLLVICTI